MLTEGLDAHCSQCILVQKVWRIRMDRGEYLEQRVSACGGKLRIRMARVKDATDPHALTCEHLPDISPGERSKVNHGTRGTTLLWV